MLCTEQVCQMKRMRNGRRDRREMLKMEKGANFTGEYVIIVVKREGDPVKKEWKGPVL